VATRYPEVSPTSTILTEICFYDEHGNIQSLKVNNIRKILQATYNYEMLEEWEINGDIYNNDIHTLDISPIDIGGDYLSMEKVSNNTQSEIHIYISCKTDIWFPWIPDRYGGVFDNRELAHCHTPRLNNFLSGVKELVLDIGGTFEIDCTSSFYEKQLSQAGISLDCECPEWIPNPYSKY
jgi:hypothetical protein